MWSAVPKRRAHLNLEALEDRCLPSASHLHSIALVSTGDPSNPSAMQGNDSSTRPALSNNGRYVAFLSGADNLVPGDTNGVSDVFVKDMLTGQLTLASKASDGTQGNGLVFTEPTISSDGRYVAFSSYADNLVPGDVNGTADVFVKDLTTGEVILASSAADGTPGNRYSANAAISADGRFVVFESVANNLIPGAAGGWNVLVKDLVTGSIVLANSASDGTQGNDGATGFSALSISADGRYVAFDSWADNLVPDDTNWSADIFVKDLLTGEMRRANTTATGIQGNDEAYEASISGEGRFVVFESYADNLVPDDGNGWYTDIFLKDMETGEIRIVSNSSDGSPGNDEAFDPYISGNGSYVAFESYSTNLVANDSNGFTPDIFVRNLTTDELSLVSKSANGVQGDRTSWNPALSANGQFVAFQSRSDNLVPGDANGEWDVFRVGVGVVPPGLIDNPGNISPSTTLSAEESAVLDFLLDSGLIQSITFGTNGTKLIGNVGLAGLASNHERIVSLLSSDCPMEPSAHSNTRSQYFTLALDHDGDGVYEVAGRLHQMLDSVSEWID